MVWDDFGAGDVFGEVFGVVGVLSSSAEVTSS